MDNKTAIKRHCLRDHNETSVRNKHNLNANFQKNARVIKDVFYFLYSLKKGLLTISTVGLLLNIVLLPLKHKSIQKSTLREQL